MGTLMKNILVDTNDSTEKNFIIWARKYILESEDMFGKLLRLWSLGMKEHPICFYLLFYEDKLVTRKEDCSKHSSRWYTTVMSRDARSKAVRGLSGKKSPAFTRLPKEPMPQNNKAKLVYQVYLTRKNDRFHHPGGWLYK